MNRLLKTAALAGLLLVAGSAQATETEARAILKGMSDYIAALSSIETTVDTSIEIVTPQMEKIAFASTSVLKLQRPNKVRLERTGGYVTVDFIFDGKDFTVRDRLGNRYAQVPLKGTTDNLVDVLQNELGLAVPAADLLLQNSYAVLVADVLEAKLIGQGVVGGQMCDHIAFRNLETDWQLWVRQGPEKAPCKMIITTKTVGMAPQYTTHVRSWKGNVPFPASTFAFRPAAGEQRLDLGKMSGIDEIPPTPAKGEQK